MSDPFYSRLYDLPNMGDQRTELSHPSSSRARSQTTADLDARAPHSCIKVRYPSRQAAWRALDAMDAQPHSPGQKRPTRAYRCPHCKGWHLTASAHRRFRKAA